MSVPLVVGDNTITVTAFSEYGAPAASVPITRDAPVDVVTSISPANGESNASTSGIVVNLNRPLDTYQVELRNAASQTGAGFGGSIFYDATSLQIRFFPDPPLAAFTAYSATFSGTTASGVVVPKSWTFTTGG